MRLFGPNYLLSYSMMLLCGFFCTNSVFGQLTAEFSASDTMFCENDASKQKVIFEDLSSSTTTIIRRTWDFGNGVVLENPPDPITQLYTSDGVYTVSLEVEDANGNIENAELELTVFAIPEFEVIADKTSGCKFFEFQFSVLKLVNEPYINYVWNFGDGTTSQSDNPKKKFELEGTYSPSLTVLNENGCYNTFKSPLITVFPDPVAQYSVSDSIFCSRDNQVDFFNESTGTPPLSASWVFPTGNSNAFNATYIYQPFGVYTTQLIITDGNGCKDTLTKPNHIIQEQFEAQIEVSQLTVCVGEILQFNFNGSQTANQFDWDFGDGGFSSRRNPTKLYSEPGIYTVSLESSNGKCSSTAQVQIEVFEVEADFTLDKQIACDTPTVVIAESLPNKGTAPFTFQWIVGNDTITEVGDSSSVDIILNNQGAFDVGLIVTDANGCKTSISKEDAVELSIPTASVEIVPDEGCVPFNSDIELTVNTGVVAGNVVSYDWTLDGTNIHSGPGPVSTQITEIGIHQLVINMETENGCIITVVDTIKGGELPIVDFIADPLKICAGEIIQFTDLTIFPDDNAPDEAYTWLWDFGDGGSSELQNPTYDYKFDDGIFDVSLIVGFYGCYDSIQKIEYIEVIPPVVELEVLPVDCENPRKRTFVSVGEFDDNKRWFLDGDNTVISTADTFEYVFPSIGKKRIELEVEYEGCTNDSRISETITEPNANIILSQPTVNCSNEMITIRHNSLDPDNNKRLTFLSGSDTIVPFQTVPVQIDTQFLEPGFHEIILVMRDMYGCEDRDTVIFESVPIPMVSFSGDTSGCLPDFEVNLNNTTQHTKPITKVEWFVTGNGQVLRGDQDEFSFTLNEAGSYTVFIRVTDEIGCNNDISIPEAINVSNLNLDVNIADTIQCLGSNFLIEFTSDKIGEADFIWDYGNGETNNSITGDHFYSYDASGVYTISVTGDDPGGCFRKLEFPIEIQEAIADFNADTTYAACPPLDVVFTPNVSPQNKIASYLWSFGDGRSSVEEFPENRYLDVGVFDVSLIIETNAGCKDTIIYPQLIEVNGPTASFQIPSDTACLPFELEFSISDTNGVKEYTWLFGDGGSASDTSPVSHEYTSAGTFFPTVFISDGVDCSVEIGVNSPIIIQEVIADFDLKKDSACGELAVDIENNSVGSRFEWLAINANLTSSNSIPNFLINQVGIEEIQLIATSSAGCKDTLIKEVEVFPIPEINLGPDTTICFNSDIQLQAQGADTYSWSPASQFNNPNISNPIFTPNQEVNIVSVTVENEYLCTASDSLTISVYPELIITVSDDQEIFLGDSTDISFTSNLPDGYSFYWEGPNNSSFYNQEEKVAPRETAVYTLFFEDSFGCVIGKQEVLIEVIELYSVDLPDVFMPQQFNSDNSLALRGIGIQEVLVFQVWNRFGNKVYEQFNVPLSQAVWNGFYKGKLQTSDNYLVIAEVKFQNGVREKIVKEVALIR